MTQAVVGAPTQETTRERWIPDQPRVPLRPCATQVDRPLVGLIELGVRACSAQSGIHREAAILRRRGLLCHRSGTDVATTLTPVGWRRRTKEGAGMDLALSDEQQAVRDWARAFITKELIPLEQEVLRRERAGEIGFPAEQNRGLQLKAKDFGFWGLSTPEEYGGMGLSAVLQSLIWTELGRTYVPFRFGGEADNILFHANEEQKAEYLLPTIAGDRVTCFAITEPGAGSDAANITFAARPTRPPATGSSTARRPSSPTATTPTS